MIHLAITGGPNTGKTMMADALGRTVHHTDDVKDLGWSEASLAVSRWFDDPACAGSVVEGVAVPRALRKWLERNEGNDERPCERVIYLTTPRAEANKGQQTMAKGCRTVWDGIRDELVRRGVVVEER